MNSVDYIQETNDLIAKWMRDDVTEEEYLASLNKLKEQHGVNVLQVLADYIKAHACECDGEACACQAISYFQSVV